MVSQGPGCRVSDGSRVQRVGQWFYRRRCFVALNVLRGASYAAGSSSVGLLVMWAQSRH